MRLSILGREIASFERESRSSYTDAIVDALARTATGVTQTDDHSKIASVEICRGLWARAFASATITPENNRTAGLTPQLLARMGERLLLSGQAVYLIEIEGGAVALREVNSYSVDGGPNPASHRYEVTLDGPSDSVTQTVSRDALVHVDIGGGPFGRIPTTLKLAARLESKLSDEVNSPVGNVLPVPAVDTALQNDISALAGETTLIETTQAGYGDMQNKPMKDFEAQRIGANPPPTLEGLRESANRTILAAAGVPQSLLGGADGTYQRELFRFFQVTTVEPLGKLVQSELRASLDVPDLTLDFGEVRGADITGRSRAVGSLVQAGVPLATALRIVGLEDAA